MTVESIERQLALLALSSIMVASAAALRTDGGGVV